MSTPAVVVLRSRECDAEPWDGSQWVDTVFFYRRHDGDPEYLGSELKANLPLKARAMVELVTPATWPSVNRYLEKCADMLGYLQFLTEPQARAARVDYVYILYLDYPPELGPFREKPFRVMLEVYEHGEGDGLSRGRKLYGGSLAKYKPKNQRNGDEEPKSKRKAEADKPKVEVKPAKPSPAPVPTAELARLSGLEQLKFVSVCTSSKALARSSLPKRCRQKPSDV